MIEKLEEYPFLAEEEEIMTWKAGIRFVKNFTPPDFRAINFTHFISPNCNSFGDENTKNE